MHIALSQDWVSRLVPAPTCFYLSFMSVTILTMRTCMQEVISCYMYDRFTHGPSVVHSPPHRQSCTQAQSAFISRANACTRTMYGPTTTQTMPSNVYSPLTRRMGFQHEQTRGGKAWYPTRSLVHTLYSPHGEIRAKDIWYALGALMGRPTGRPFCAGKMQNSFLFYFIRLCTPICTINLMFVGNTL